jgi:hypothetical protein
MAGAMAKEYQTWNDLAFPAGCNGRNCSGKALKLRPKIKKSGAMRDAALFKGRRLIFS